MKEIIALAEANMLFKEVEGKNKDILNKIHEYNCSDELSGIDNKEVKSKNLKKHFNQYLIQ